MFVPLSGCTEMFALESFAYLGTHIRCLSVSVHVELFVFLVLGLMFVQF